MQAGEALRVGVRTSIYNRRFKYAPPKPSLELLFAQTCLRLRASRFVIFQDHRSPIDRRWDAASLMFSEAITKVFCAADVEIAVVTSEPRCNIWVCGLQKCAVEGLNL
jgi:hypothetical protein